MIKNICRGDVCTVPVGLAAHHGIKPLELHLVGLQILRREVTGAVGGDANVHKENAPLKDFILFVIKL
jgi:hypothetical protein